MSDVFIGEHSRPNDKTYHDWDTLGFNSAREAFLKVIKNVTPP